jgi:hypothetical protein
MIPLWFKLAYTAFVAIVVAIWLRHYGWRNLLWFSDIALLGAVPALWLGDARIASVLAVAVLLPEMLWNVDLAGRLLFKRRISGLTDYMFEPERPLLLRRLSLFHVPLPLVLLWLLAANGYAERIALPGAALLAAVVLPASRALSTPEKNINWSWGLGPARSPLPTVAYLALLFGGFVLLVFIPTHAILRNTFH